MTSVPPSSEDILFFSEWLVRASADDKQSLLDSLSKDAFINDDAIPEQAGANGIFESYVYIINVQGCFLPVFRSVFNDIRQEIYTLIRDQMQ